MSSIDFLGGNFKLTYSTYTGKHQTSLGGCVTVLLGLVVLSSSVFIFSQYFNTEAPIVTSSTELHSKYTEFDLYEEELFTPVSVVVGGSLVPTRAVGRFITPQIEMEEYSFNNQTRNYQLKMIHTYKFVPCDSLDDEKVLEVHEKINSVAGELKGHSLCPDFKNDSSKYRAMRNLSSSVYYFPKLSIFPCSLPDKTQCASSTELSFASLSYASIEKLMVSSDFDSPISLSPEVKTIDLDVSLRKKRQLEVRLNRLEDDTLILRDPKLKKEFVTQHQLESDYKKRPESQTYCSGAQIAMGVFGGCQEYFLLNYSPSGKIVKIRRSYRKLTTVLGELGGFLKLVTSVVFVVYSYYNTSNVKNFIAKNLYNLGGGRPGKASSKNKHSKLFSKEFNRKEKRKSVQKNKIQDSSTSKQKNNKKPLVDPKKYEEVVKECVKTRRCGMDMLSKLDFVEMLQELMFEEHDKVLLPLLILRLKEKQIKQKKHRGTENQLKGQKSEKKNQKVKEKKKVHSKNQRQKKVMEKEEEKEQQNQPDEEEGGTYQNNSEFCSGLHMDYEDAFYLLVSSKPKTGLKKAVKRLMLENVKTFFEPPGDENKRLVMEKPVIQITEKEPKREVKRPKDEEEHRKSEKKIFKKSLLTMKDLERQRLEKGRNILGSSKNKSGDDLLRHLLNDRPLRKKNIKKIGRGSSRRMIVSPRPGLKKEIDEKEDSFQLPELESLKDQF